ncbi:MAG: transposase family protein [Cyclobacteriaceae bacterium]|nr:transposase family protein [Cyclobacteriaceae bacterium]
MPTKDKAQNQSIFEERLKAAYKDYDASLCPIYTSVFGFKNAKKAIHCARKHSVYRELISVLNEIEAEEIDKRLYGYKTILHSLISAFQFDKPRVNPNKTGYDNLFKIVNRISKHTDTELGIQNEMYHKPRKNNLRFEDIKPDVINLIMANRTHAEDYPLSRLAPKIHSLLQKKGHSTAPSYSTIKLWANQAQINVKTTNTRQGKDSERALVVPKIETLKPKPGVEWQVDGTRFGLPYYNKNKPGYYKDDFLKIILVVDVGSNKILGYSFAESEDHKAVLEALHCAVKLEKHLPKRILFDNASGNKLIETEYGNQFLANGVNLDFTPRGYAQSKGCVEKIVDVLEQYYFQNIPGFVLGIKNKRRKQPEYVAKQLKNKFTKEEVIAAGIIQIQNYNTDKYKGASPTQKYQVSEETITLVNDELRAFLFWNRRTVTFKNACVALEFKRKKYTFDLDQSNTDLIIELTGRAVTVFYYVSPDNNLEDVAFLMCNESEKEGLIKLNQRIEIDRLERTPQQEEVFQKLMTLKKEIPNKIRAIRKEAAQISKDEFGETSIELLSHANTTKEVLDNAENDFVLNEVRQMYQISSEEMTLSGKKKVKSIEEPIDSSDVTEADKPKYSNRFTEDDDDVRMIDSTRSLQRFSDA